MNSIEYHEEVEDVLNKQRTGCPKSYSSVRYTPGSHGCPLKFAIGSFS